MHIPSLVKIHWRLLKLSSGNEKRTDGRTDGPTTDGRTDRLTDVQRETIIPRHYCVARYKKERALLSNADSKTLDKPTHQYSLNVH